MITIREMSDADVESVAQIEREAFGAHAWSSKLFFDELKDETKHYLVVMEDDKLIAYGGFAHIIDEGHIMNIAVDKRSRGKGIGVKLLDGLILLAKSLGIGSMTLEVRADNVAAIALYEGRNFVFAGARRDYYGKGESALIYWLTL